VARVRPGHRVAVVDVSEGGALLEAHHPLRPGAGVELQFERADGRVRLAATVLRCGVSALDPHRGPTYRAAVSFGQPFDWTREAATPYGQGVPARRAAAGGRTHK
jgi:hypothetical protein